MYTNKFHSREEKLVFLRKIILFLIDIKLSGKTGEHKGEYVLYHQMMVLLSNYNVVEELCDELLKKVGFMNPNGKERPYPHRNSFNKVFISLIKQFICEF